MDWESLKKNVEGAIPRKQNFEDPRFWKLSRDENDNGSAIIRLLPDPEGIPLVKIYEHSIRVFNKGTGKYRYYIQPSPSSIGLPCPASEEWEKWNSLGTEEGKKMASLFKRRTQYITNILVVNDPANSENNGKVFLWKFGIKLLDKFLAALEPSETDKAMGIQPVELFSLFKGANIMLKAKKVAGFINYDDTVIMQPSGVAKNEEEAKKILSQTYNLKEFLSPDYYLPYEELRKKLDWVLGKVSKQTTKTSSNTEDKRAEKLKSLVGNSTPVSSNVNENTENATNNTTNSTSNNTTNNTTTEASAPKVESSAPDDDLSFLDDL